MESRFQGLDGMKNDSLDRPYLADLIAKFGMPKIEHVTSAPRSAIYQWKPSRGAVPAEPALRINEFYEDLGFYVERLCPDLPWHLLYRGRDRRTGTDGLDVIALAVAEGVNVLETVVKHVGVTNIARLANRSRQNIYEALKSERNPVWLILAVEEVSERRFLVEDFRPELPWWPLYQRHTKVRPVKLRSSDE